MGNFKGCLLRNIGRSWSRLKDKKLFGASRSFETNIFKDFKGIGLGLEVYLFFVGFEEAFMDHFLGMRNTSFRKKSG